MPRPAGSPNKITKEVREFIAAFVQNNMDAMQRDYDMMEPAERLRFMEKMIQYIIPKKTERSEPPEMPAPNLPPWMRSAQEIESE